MAQHWAARMEDREAVRSSDWGGHKLLYGCGVLGAQTEAPIPSPPAPQPHKATASGVLQHW